MKAAQLAFLKGAPAPPRVAFCVIQVPLPGVGYVYEADVELSGGPAQVIGWRKVRQPGSFLQTSPVIDLKANVRYKVVKFISRVIRYVFAIMKPSRQ